MIFVSVGTHEAPFDRLLCAVSELGLDEELVVQHGPSSARCDRALEFEYLSFDEVVDYIKDARAVVMHAGVGSVMIALANGKRPIVMARRREFGEHVDDHQVELARRLEGSGLVTLVEDIEGLREVLSREAQPPGRMVGVPWLGDDLGTYFEEHLGAPRAPDELAARRSLRQTG
jgi:UDP-N-acetylglucosamine transferase subunit ALG13